MMLERIERTFGRRQHFDVEALEQRARTKFRPLQSLVDRVVVDVGRFGRQAHVEAEDLGKYPVEP